MKTLKKIKEDYKSQTLDGRDLDRLAQFISENELEDFGMSMKDPFIGKHKHIEFTKKNVLKQLKKDVEFGFHKALNQRGISSGLMFAVVQMWNWVLEEGLENWNNNNYAQYGLPLFKVTAEKYGFHNPIGADKGNEKIYASYQ